MAAASNTNPSVGGGGATPAMAQSFLNLNRETARRGTNYVTRNTGAPTNYYTKQEKEFNSRLKLFHKFGEKDESTLVQAYKRPITEKFGGIICDSIGFQQHGGECWSDSIQQVLFFADGFKEHTQEYFYKTPYENIVKAIDALGLSEQESINVKNYARAAQRRFINHYNFIKTGDAIFDVCELAPTATTAVSGGGSAAAKAELKRQHSLIFSTNAARSIVGYEKETSGGQITEKLIDSLFSIASLGSHIKLTDCFKKNWKGARFFTDAALTELTPCEYSKNSCIFLDTMVFHGPEPIMIKNKNDNLNNNINNAVNAENPASDVSAATSAVNYMMKAYTLFTAPGKTKLPTHAAALYFCNETLNFYDDNTGITEIGKFDLKYFERYDTVLLFINKTDKNDKKTLFCSGINGAIKHRKKSSHFEMQIEKTLASTFTTTDLLCFNPSSPGEPFSVSLEQLMGEMEKNYNVATFLIYQKTVCNFITPTALSAKSSRTRKLRRRQNKTRRTRRHS